MSGKYQKKIRRELAALQKANTDDLIKQILKWSFLKRLTVALRLIIGGD